MVPSCAMNPDNPSWFTRARPSENDSALSNSGFMTIAPVLSMNPHLPSIFTGARSSEKSFASSKRWGKRGWPALSMKAYLQNGVAAVGGPKLGRTNIPGNEEHGLVPLLQGPSMITLATPSWNGFDSSSFASIATAPVRSRKPALKPSLSEVRITVMPSENELYSEISDSWYEGGIKKSPCVLMNPHF